MEKMKETIFFEVNSECPFSCAQCYHGIKRAKLSVAEAMKRGRKLKNICRDAIPIFGEILCAPEYLEVISAVGRDEVPTTGLPLLRNSALAAQMRENGIKEARLSAHYFSEELNVCPTPLDRLPRIIDILLDNEIEPAAFIVLHRGNYLRLAEICSRAKTDGFIRIRFLNLIATNQSMLTYTLGLDEINIIFSQVEALRERYSKTNLAIHLAAKFGPPPWGKGQQRSQEGTFCTAGHESVYVRCDGSIFPCIYLIDECYRMGNYHDDVLEIDRDPLAGFNRRTCFLLCRKTRRSE